MRGFFYDVASYGVVILRKVLKDYPHLKLVNRMGMLFFRRKKHIGGDGIAQQEKSSPTRRWTWGPGAAVRAPILGGSSQWTRK